MFNNLIESSSHKREFKRRGSFFLFTTAAYALLFIVTAVVSIYAYDARLEDQNTEFVTLLSPVDFAPPKPQPVSQNTTTPHNNNARAVYDERRIAMATVDRPIQPIGISTKPNPYLPVRDGTITRISDRDSNGGEPGGPIGPLGPSTQVRNPLPIIVDIATPPPPIQKPVPKVINKRVINSEAIELPKPPYPAIAKQARVQGIVNVQVLIDETGKVITAHAVSGHPLLSFEAVRAAYRARFSPTLYGDQPVKVSGVITYNFVLQ